MQMEPKHATRQDMQALIDFLPILSGTSADLLATAGLTRSNRASIELDAQYEQAIDDFFHCCAPTAQPYEDNAGHEQLPTDRHNEP